MASERTSRTDDDTDDGLRVEPLPPDTQPADDVVVEKPHKTCSDGTEAKPSGDRNEVK